MRKSKILVLCLAAAAVPATAQTFGFSLGASAPMTCLAIGSTTWRVDGNTDRADVTVRIDPAAKTPDIRIRLAETADAADFVFVDDADRPGCAGYPATFRNVKIEATAQRPDLTLGFASSETPADYRIYVRSRWLAPETAAAIFAAARMPARTLASRATTAR